MPFDDEYAGQGGEYLLDGKGKRTLISRTAEFNEVSVQAVVEVKQDTTATEAPAAPTE